MKWYLCVALALAIAGVAAYGPGLVVPAALVEVRPAEALPTEVASAVVSPEIAAPAAPARKPAPAVRVNEQGPARVPVYRGEEIIGWVTPDATRVAEAHAIQTTRSGKAAARDRGGPRAAGARGAGTERRTGSVSRIKEEFRKAVRKRFFQKPEWVRQRSGGEFRDDRRNGRRY